MKAVLCSSGCITWMNTAKASKEREHKHSWEMGGTAAGSFRIMLVLMNSYFICTLVILPNTKAAPFPIDSCRGRSPQSPFSGPSAAKDSWNQGRKSLHNKWKDQLPSLLHLPVSWRLTYQMCSSTYPTFPCSMTLYSGLCLLWLQWQCFQPCMATYNFYAPLPTTPNMTSLWNAHVICC